MAVYHCEQCPRRFNSPHALRQHARDLHGSTQYPPTPSPLHTPDSRRHSHSQSRSRGQSRQSATPPPQTINITINLGPLSLASQGADGTQVMETRRTIPGQGVINVSFQPDARASVAMEDSGRVGRDERPYRYSQRQSERQTRSRSRSWDRNWDPEYQVIPN